jgi:hypothetical protein
MEYGSWLNRDGAWSGVGAKCQLEHGFEWDLAYQLEPMRRRVLERERK